MRQVSIVRSGEYVVPVELSVADMDNLTMEMVQLIWVSIATLLGAGSLVHMGVIGKKWDIDEVGPRLLASFAWPVVLVLAACYYTIKTPYYLGTTIKNHKDKAKALEA